MQLKVVRCRSKLHSSMRPVLKTLLVPPILAMVLWAGSMDLAGAEKQKSPRTDDPSDAFFADPAVRVFKITLADSAYSDLRCKKPAYVAGTFSDGRQVWTNIGVHLKGMGSFRAIDDKP